jgi:hypothetical protein
VYLLSSMVLHVSADRARIGAAADGARRRMGHDRFVANLLDICAAGLAAPVTVAGAKRRGSGAARAAGRERVGAVRTGQTSSSKSSMSSSK